MVVGVGDTDIEKGVVGVVVGLDNNNMGSLMSL